MPREGRRAPSLKESLFEEWIKRCLMVFIICPAIVLAWFPFNDLDVTGYWYSVYLGIPFILVGAIVGVIIARLFERKRKCLHTPKV
jgi:hypothetical protein